MNDRQLRIFLAVADQGSFSRAEEVVFISKQAMLRQIDLLEQEAGVALLNRSPLGVSLTAAGKEFYEGARELLKLQSQILSRCRGAESALDVIRVGQVEHQVLLHRVTDAFAVKYPDIRIQKVIHPNHSGEFRVANGIIDVGETFYNSAVTREPYAYTRLADMPYLAAMALNHPLCTAKTLSLAELTDFPTIVFQQMVKQPYLMELHRLFHARGRDSLLIVREDVDNQVAVAFACSTSDQILLTANLFVREIPQLVSIPLDNGWNQEYGIIYRPNPVPVVQKYIDLAVTLFREDPHSSRCRPAPLSSEHPLYTPPDSRPGN